jgi:hypothetical protein
VQLASPKDQEPFSSDIGAFGRWCVWQWLFVGGVVWCFGLGKGADVLDE